MSNQAPTDVPAEQLESPFAHALTTSYAGLHYAALRFLAPAPPKHPKLRWVIRIMWPRR